MPLAKLAKGFLAIHQFAAVSLGNTVFDLCCDAGAVVGQLLFVFVEHLHGLCDEFIGRLIGAALDVLLNEGLQLRF
jgi:hypothetical protein